METRSIAIGLVAVIAAFAAAFAISSSGGTKEETAGAGVKAQSITVAAPAAVAGVEVGGTLPALRAERKAPAKKKKKASKRSTPSTSSTASAPSTTNTAPSAPSTQNTAPSAPRPSAPAPSAPQPSAPKPSKPAGPISGGGEDG
jgi:translation initiation factor IF-2